MRYTGETSLAGMNPDAEKYVGGQSIEPGTKVYPLEKIRLEIVEKDWEDIPLYLDGYTSKEEKTLYLHVGDKVKLCFYTIEDDQIIDVRISKATFENERVLTVNDNGIIYAKAAGAFPITVTCKDCGRVVTKTVSVLVWVD